MLIRKPGGHPAARSTLQKTNLEEVRFIYVFDSVDFLAEDGCDRVYSYRAASKAFDHGTQKFSIDFIESMLVDVEEFQRVAGAGSRDLTISLDLRVIPNSFQQTIRYAWRPAATHRD